jgi:hypothetical protein
VVRTEIPPSKISDKDAVRAEAARMCDIIESHPLPCVLKLPQAFGGQGVFIVKDKAELEEAMEVLRPEVEKMILQLTESNPSLHSNGVVIQDFIRTDKCEGVNFFVTKSGKAVFLGAAPQQLDEANQWCGSRICYTEQPAKEKKYIGIVDKVVKALHEKKYFGPCGIDVIHSPEGEQLVIDLNPRISASYQLPLLKGHFQDRLGLPEASLYFPLGLTCSREQFEAAFQQEIADGKIVICGWCESMGGPGNKYRFTLASVAVAGKTDEELRELSGRVLKFRIQK